MQQSLAALLGARADPPQAAAKRPAVYVADVLRWDAEEEGEKAPQKQVKEGPVRYAIESEKEYIILKLGSDETHHRYWHDSDCADDRC